MLTEQEYIFIANDIEASLRKNNISNLDPTLSDAQVSAIKSAIIRALIQHDKLMSKKSSL